MCCILSTIAFLLIFYGNWIPFYYVLHAHYDQLHFVPPTTFHFSFSYICMSSVFVILLVLFGIAYGERYAMVFGTLPKWEDYSYASVGSIYSFNMISHCIGILPCIHSFASIRFKAGKYTLYGVYKCYICR